MSTLSFVAPNTFRQRLLICFNGGNSYLSSKIHNQIKDVSPNLQQHQHFSNKIQTACPSHLHSIATTTRFHVSNSTWQRNSTMDSRKNLLVRIQHAPFSTVVEPSAAATSVTPDGIQIHAEPTIIQPSIVQSADGRQFAAFEIPKFHRKLKPYIVKRRLNRMRTFVGKQKDIRHSPWRMNLVCQFAAGQTLTDAIQQLEFCRKSLAPTVKKVLIRTANVADMKYGLQHSQLEVAECFATKGKPLKRLMIMGRGRAGRMEHKFSHFRVVLREIDFKLRMYLAPTLGEKKRWFLRQQLAEADYAKAKAERDEISRLEKETEAYRTKETDSSKK